jgi:parallel beta-helix repeat protein
VDYTSCHSNSTSILPHALRTGDTAFIADGTYPAFAVEGPLSNTTIMGSGPDTIIDAMGVGSAVELSEFNNSQIQNLQLQNSNTAITSAYEITHQLYEYNGNTYDQSTAAVGSPNIALLFGDANCNAVLLSADATNIDTAVGTATDDWNLGLVDLFGSKMTILVPNRFVSSGPDLITYTTNNCGAAITVDLFLPSIFTVNSENYTYNAAAVALAGVSLKPGLTSPPELSRNVSITAAGGLFLQNSSNNTFQGISYSGNTIGVYLDPDSNGNTFFENTFSANTSFDLSSEATGNNTLDQTTFDLNKVQIDGTGLINVYYRARAFIQKDSTPIQNASVTFTDAQNNVEGPLLTDAMGLTPYTNSMLAIVLDETNPHVVTSGNLNPFTVEATTPNGIIFITENLSQANQQFEIEENSGRRRGKNLECTDCTIPESENGGGVGGGGSSTSPQHEAAEEPMTSSFTGYDDLTSEDQDFEAFKYAYEQGIFTGHADNTARADDALQRDQAAKIVAHFSREYSIDKDYCQGKKPFRDISLHFWGAQVICFGKQTGYITGYTDKNIYLPAKPMNRAEFLALILRSLPDLEWTESAVSYRDVLPNKWYSPFAKFAYEQELFLTSSFQKLFPDRIITRRDVVRIIYKLKEFRDILPTKIPETGIQKETLLKIKIAE